MNTATEPAPVLTPPAFADVYRTYFRYVWRVLVRLGVRVADLEDKAQEVFMVVHRRLGDYDPSRPIRPWLAGIAHRVALAEIRRAHNRREKLVDPPMSRQVDRTARADQLIEQKQRRVRVHQALESLDMDRRVVFVMYELEGIPCVDISEALSIPVNTVYSRLRIARERFKAAWERLRIREAV